MRLTVVLLIISFNIFAYNHSKCMNGTKDYIGPIGVSVSFSSFFTSTGDCALIGAVQQRQQFFYANKEQMLNDIAKGLGEYLASYGFLSSCSGERLDKASLGLQRQMSDLLNVDEGKQFELIESRFQESCRI